MKKIERFGPRPGPFWTRRDFLVGSVALCGAASLAASTRLWADAPERLKLPSKTMAALADSSLVYISPLLADGQESRCHGEVWFFVDAGDVVIFADKKSWKVRAVGRGRDRARIFVGDFGPVSRAGDRFRKAPTFLAQVEIDTSAATFERLMKAYGERYPDEWGKWGPRFRKGYEADTRAMVRYRPVSG